MTNSGESFTVEQALANLKQRDDLSLCYYAAWWLGKFRIRDAAVIDALIVALEEEADRTEAGGYPLKRNAARALGKLGDRKAVVPLINSLDCSDFYVREAAAQSLGMLGDPVCSPQLMGLLEGGIEAAKRVPGSPHLAQPYNAVIEALGSLGAKQAIALIEPFLEHDQERIQYAATRAMYQLTGNPAYGDRLVQALKGEKLQLRRAVLADLGAIGYLKAADAIAQTLAENSLKLISLKGVLEHEVKKSASESVQLSEGAIHVIKLMDNLL